MTLIWCLLEQNNCKLIIMTHDYLTIQFYCFVREMGSYLHKKIMAKLKSCLYYIIEIFPRLKSNQNLKKNLKTPC